MSDLVDYADWKLKQCKNVMHMTDDELAKVLGVSRPKVRSLIDNPGNMTFIMLDSLENHLKTVASLLKAEAMA